MSNNYHLENIRTLLTLGFTSEELRRFCYDDPEFRSVYNQLAQNSGKAEIIDHLIEYADRKIQFDKLLAWAKEHNLPRYKEHQPYYLTSQPSASLRDLSKKSERTEKQRMDRRRRFADHIESEIRRLNNLEEWRDYRFTELEAEIEAEGRRRTFSLFPFFSKTGSGLRREQSLSKALEVSQERLILLEGDPGSGKSVALRYVAQSMARRAMKAKNTKSVIPIYVTLKELERNEDQVIDRNLIETFVLKSLNRANDRDIEEFLEEEFDEGLENGTWLFLFDSFDEIPEVLSSTEADVTIRRYADAISDFLHGLNQCRGIIASRQFRGPGQSGWPRFRILPLSETRRLELIQKAELKPDLEKYLIGGLGAAEQEIRSMASNPLFLGLLCEHVRTGHAFPENVHSVFETYVNTRLTRDQERLQRRFALTPVEIRLAAENLAFCMSADIGLGLSPSRESLAAALERRGFTLPDRFATLLDGLEYIKLARSEVATKAGESKSFTFAHRRFQEYFATCIVLRQPELVTPTQLLTDARWRETAVVMCQTQPVEALLPIIEEARSLLSKIVDDTPDLIDTPLAYVETFATTAKSNETGENKNLPKPFSWPAGVLHLLGLLQAGFSGRLGELPDDIRLQAGRLILSASIAGTLPDKKCALEVAGIVPQPILVWLLRDAFATQSQWLKEVAYRQTARLSQLPEDITNSIRQALINMLVGGRLQREYHTTHAHLSRLDNATHFLSILRLLLQVRWLDRIFLLFLLCMIAIFWQKWSIWQVWPFLELSNTNLLMLTLVLLIFSYWTLFDSAYVINQISTSGKEYKLVSVEALFTGFIGLYARLFLPFPPTIFNFLLPFAFSAIFAVLAARTGQFIHPFFWFLMPLWPILYFGRNTKKALAWLKQNRRSVYGVLIVIGLSLLLPLLKIPFIIIEFYFLTIGVLVMLPSLPFLKEALEEALVKIYWIKDWFTWYKWIHSRQVLVTGQEFLNLLTQYHIDTFRLRFIGIVQAQGLLVFTAETDDLIEDLTLTLEREYRLRYSEGILRRSQFNAALIRLAEFRIDLYFQGLQEMWLDQTKHKSLTDNLNEPALIPASKSKIFERWYTDYAKGKNRLAKWDSQVLDEFSKLLEQVRANRGINR